MRGLNTNLHTMAQNHTYADRQADMATKKLYNSLTYWTKQQKAKLSYALSNLLEVLSNNHSDSWTYRKYIFVWPNIFCLIPPIHLYWRGLSQVLMQTNLLHGWSSIKLLCIFLIILQKQQKPIVFLSTDLLNDFFLVRIFCSTHTTMKKNAQQLRQFQVFSCYKCRISKKK